MIIKKYNRNKTRISNKKLFWCWCDLTYIGSWNKCKICFRRNGRKRNKKNYKEDDLFL